MTYFPNGNARSNSMIHRMTTATHNGALFSAAAIVTQNAANARIKNTVSMNYTSFVIFGGST
jgi:hypothetical protein